MSVKDELHELVNRLTDDDAEDALVYLRELAQSTAAPAHQFTTLVVDGQTFFDSPGSSLETLAKQQGVVPVARFDDLRGDFWPVDETVDEFLAALKEWRSEGAHG